MIKDVRHFKTPKDDLRRQPFQDTSRQIQTMANRDISRHIESVQDNSQTKSFQDISWLFKTSTNKDISR